MPHSSPCPNCNTPVLSPFLIKCPYCAFDLTHLVGNLSPQGQNKRIKHTELLTSGTIQLHKGEYNASFDHYGLQNLEELVRYALSYGHHATVKSPRGNHQNPVIVAYIPEIIGSGVSRYSADYLPASGICIISPSSVQWGHPYPMLDGWAQKEFNGLVGSCFRCGAVTPFGQTVCTKCYGEIGSNWKSLLV